MNFLLAALQAVAFGSNTPNSEPLPPKKAQLKFSQLAAEHRNALYRFLLSQGATPDFAEDCLQEALVRAYRSLDSLRDWQRAKSWLFGITRNVFIDETRRRTVRSRPLPADDALSPATADEQFEQAERADSLKRAVDELNPPKGKIIELHYGRGLNLEEISSELNMPLGTIKTHLHRARAALRKQLAAMEVS